MATGLYDPAYEHDACGVGMVADLHGRPDHDIVDRGLTVLERLAHRGASGAEVETGDGAGILVQVPHRFLAAAAQEAGFTLPDAGGYAVGLAFLPTDADDAAQGADRRGADGGRGGADGARVAHGAHRARGPRPDRAGRHAADRAALRGPGRTRRRHDGASSAGPSCCASGWSTRSTSVYFPSLSARTIVYKGMLTSEQLRQFFPDLRDPTLRVRPGPGALALLDQHVPELAAGPPVPLPVPQRRDQHAGRQPQLDAGPRGAARDAR